ncbi:MAG TPA: hypothetical protein DCE42_19065 [Myxococcales bacterium]|nr:hypothetical protein [Deltaproteobacteria bacterium]MBK03134.1 hypothetical protein [Deltaproteobacteria bacterium]MBU47313.1 hypothetical protein [Deltaproteobacteria bacterium]HAA56875.1 hypothetical protein [Myxococcales bacterium]
MLLELHSSARFAWQQKKTSETDTKPSMTPLNSLLLFVHNALFWFFLLPFFTSMSYGFGFAAFSIILFTRFLGNLYINVRDLTTQQYYAYPFRIP